MLHSISLKYIAYFPMNMHMYTHTMQIHLEVKLLIRD